MILQQKNNFFVCFNSVSCLRLLCFQIIYLDNLDFGGSRTRQYILPRIVDFRYDVIRSMIQLDTNPNARDDGEKFGKLEV
jgi:hypothetical protein